MTDLQDPEVAPAPEPADGPDDGPVPHAGLRLAALLAALVALGIWRPWVLIVVSAIVVMITLHEFGHYYMAKRAGMKVTEFFLFFGPKVWSMKRGETEYGIKCIPAGAYVKIIGMTNLEEVPEADEGRSYRQKTFAQRVGVAVAGSTMHFLLALSMIFVALVAIGQPSGSLDQNTQAKEWQISDVTDGSGAAAAGLKQGDKVTRIDGTAITTFDDLRNVVDARSGQTVPVTYVRDGEASTVDVTLRPFYSWLVARVPIGSGPAEAGLEIGDRIVEIGGTNTRRTADLSSTLAALEGQTVPVTIERQADDGAVSQATTDLRIDSLILAGSEGHLGVGAGYPPDEKLSPLRGLVRTPVEFFNVTKLSVSSLGKFFTPGGISDFAGQVGNAGDEQKAGTTVPTSNDSSATLLDRGAAQPGANRLLSIYGLVRIGASAGEVNPAGLITLFALINIFIGVFNLVPLLPFDGGHVLIAVYEKIQEKRLDRRRYFTDVSRLLPLTYVVVIMLGMLFISTLYLDIANPLKIQ